eukprot:10875239-Ditylum_brightwellii.AAC.1
MLSRKWQQTRSEKQDTKKLMKATKFNARSKLLGVIQRMALVDKRIYIKSINTKEIWWDDKTIPSGEKFNDKFKFRQEVNQAGRTAMFMYMKIVHKFTWKEIQFLE